MSYIHSPPAGPRPPLQLDRGFLFRPTHIFLMQQCWNGKRAFCVIRLHSSSQFITELITTARSVNPSLRCIVWFYLQQSCDESWEALALGLKPWKTAVVGTWSAGLCCSWHLYLKSFSSATRTSEAPCLGFFHCWNCSFHEWSKNKTIALERWCTKKDVFNFKFYC
jgi:hypothetical protein